MNNLKKYMCVCEDTHVFVYMLIHAYPYIVCSGSKDTLQLMSPRQTE